MCARSDYYLGSIRIHSALQRTTRFFVHMICCDDFAYGLDELKFLFVTTVMLFQQKAAHFLLRMIFNDVFVRERGASRSWLLE